MPGKTQFYDARQVWCVVYICFAHQRKYFGLLAPQAQYDMQVCLGKIHPDTIMIWHRITEEETAS